MDFQEITQYERKLYNDGIKYIAGIDEVGRGPLAGPFVVSAVILDLEKIFGRDFEELIEKLKINDIRCREKDNNKELLYTQIKDSKKVTPKKRDILADFIKNEAISYSIEVFGPEEVDKYGVSQITQLAFFKAVKDLEVKPQYVLTDTFEVKKITKEEQINIVKGDNKSISIAAASIVAKVYRDNIMVEMHKKYPIYGFDRHKGYGTRYHMDILRSQGPCEIHRKTYEPIKSMLLSKLKSFR